MPMPSFDKIGREIKIGSIIVYGHALGRSAGLKIGKVVRINEKKRSWDDSITTTFSVFGVEEDFSDKLSLSKIGTLHYSNRIIVLKDVPAKYYQILDKV